MNPRSMPDPHDTDVKAALLRMVQIFESGDLADIRFVVSDHYLDHQGLGGSGIRGRDGFARVVSAARSTWRDLRVTAEDLIADGDRVAARLHWHGTNEQGTPIDRETIDIVRFADALAVEHWGTRLWSSE